MLIFFIFIFLRLDFLVFLQVVGVLNLGGAVGCMLSEGPWLFVGLTNLVKAWNIETSLDLSLNGPVGQVYSLVVGNDLLFAGVQEGTILAWKFNVATNSFEPAASLKGHTLAVVTLVVGANRVYSGSMDHSIKVWDLETLRCLQTLTEHIDVVMSLLCWDQFLLSASLDKTVKCRFGLQLRMGTWKLHLPTMKNMGYSLSSGCMIQRPNLCCCARAMITPFEPMICQHFLREGRSFPNKRFAPYKLVPVVCFSLVTDLVK
ncbi:zinc finger CCCH domain-containing protein 63-like isoform X2 [Olea europaea var. sylvestris]|uniref:zinc finger CCCH domain-containing protein 63-like isoform X2 n=1 Tax=Olea europaea var. sylvestris TaxID=158386 RepID=UPI000C1CD904|nr:zinc finger CCCH domain-containing protein 63-like isoform X2 [Olea europaea var. sylvestris]